MLGGIFKYPGGRPSLDFANSHNGVGEGGHTDQTVMQKGITRGWVGWGSPAAGRNRYGCWCAYSGCQGVTASLEIQFKSTVRALLAQGSLPW